MLGFAYRPYVPVNTHRPRKPQRPPKPAGAWLSAWDWRLKLSLAFILGVAAYAVKLHFDHQRLLQVGQKTVGVVVRPETNHAVVSFWVNGRWQEQVMSSLRLDLYAGETYAVRYDPADAGNAEALFDEPVFDKRAYAATPATHLSQLTKPFRVEFEYAVGQRTLTRRQLAHSDRPLDPTRPAHVYYNRTDPRIAYLVY